MSQKPGLDPARLKTHAGPDGTLTEPVFVSLLQDWNLLGCVRTLEGAPVYAGTFTGAAVRGRYPSGTGWPAGGMR